MTTANTLPTVLTEGHIAEVLGVTYRQVRKWVRSGEIAGRILPDGSAVATSAAIEAYANGGPLLKTTIMARKKKTSRPATGTVRHFAHVPR
jgi:predicted site-specific integrase-resolvase